MKKDENMLPSRLRRYNASQRAKTSSTTRIGRTQQTSSGSVQNGVGALDTGNAVQTLEHSEVFPLPNVRI